MNRTDSNIVTRARVIWAELDRAQRRMFELRTGIGPVKRASGIQELEDVYARSGRN